MKTLFSYSKKESIRIDYFLSLKFKNFSRTYFQYLIEKTHILINDQTIKKKYILKYKDQIYINFLSPPQPSLKPQNIPLDILYEDNHILCINKPCNMVVHPAPGNPENTFVNALLYHCKNLEITDEIRPGIVHRLDKETSGILIAAKTYISHQKLVKMFANKQIKKKYLAICINHPKEGILEKNIKRHPILRKKMHVHEKGKKAISKFVILDKTADLSFVQVSPYTGRTHQIRVHLQYLKSPILGDKLYGNLKMNKKFLIKRHLLHAHQISFTHPITKKYLSLTAEIPSDMQSSIKTFFKKSWPNIFFIYEKNKKSDLNR